MDVMDVKELRKKKLIDNIENSINRDIIERLQTETNVQCPNDLYEEIKQWFECLGFHVWRKCYEITDNENDGIGKYNYCVYIGIYDEK